MCSSDLAVEFAVEWLTGMFGASVKRALGRSHVTQWGAEPWTLGAIAAAAPGGGSNGNDAGGWNYVPNAFMSWQFSDRLWAGIGLTVPFGLKTNYDPTFIGRFQSQKSQYMRVSGLIARFSPAPRARKRCRCMTAPGAGMPAPCLISARTRGSV